jgi:hypothetical protein
MDSALRCDQDSEMANASSHLTRARGSELAYSNPELKAVRRVLSRTRSAANTIVWGAAMQRRSSRIAGILRSLPNLVLGPIVNRTKGPGAWLVTVQDADGREQLALRVVTHGAAQTVEQLAEPIPIRVHRRELVNLPRLQQLLRNGSVTVEFTEARP